MTEERGQPERREPVVSIRVDQLGPGSQNLFYSLNTPDRRRFKNIQRRASLYQGFGNLVATIVGRQQHSRDAVLVSRPGERRVSVEQLMHRCDIARLDGFDNSPGGAHRKSPYDFRVSNKSQGRIKQRQKSKDEGGRMKDERNASAFILAFLSLFDSALGFVRD